MNDPHERAGVTTPWGQSQNARVIAPGIVLHTTAGHGGFYLSPERNACVPVYMRRNDGWYEEDCDWAIVATVYAAFFDEQDRAAADEALRQWHPDAWERWTGKTLEPGQSRTRDRRDFEARHAEAQVVVAAWEYPVPGAEIPDTHVLVCARTGGCSGEDGKVIGARDDARETWHLVPKEHYSARSPFGYVVPAGTPETDIRPLGEEPRPHAD